MSKSSEMVLYRTCKRMIQRGTIDGLAEKIDIFYAAGKLPDLCERLMTRLETSGADTTAERGEFAVLVAECGSSGCKWH